MAVSRFHPFSKYTICSHPQCAKVIAAGRYYCADHAKQPIQFKQSEKVSPKLAKRNAMVSQGQCYVYAVAASGLVKFGKALDVDARLSSLQTGSPVELELLGAILGPKDLESQVHAWARPHHHRGEWFKRTDPVEQLIGRIISGDLDRLMAMLKKPVDYESNPRNLGN